LFSLSHFFGWGKIGYFFPLSLFFGFGKNWGFFPESLLFWDILFFFRVWGIF
jgi:hypothetical protein